MPGEELAVHFFFKFLQWRDRHYIAALREQYDADALREKYGKRTVSRVAGVLAMLLLLFAGLPAIWYGVYQLLKRELHQEHDVQIVWSYVPQFVAGALLGFIGAFTIVLTFALLHARWRYGADFHEYLAHECLKVGYNVPRRTTQMLLIMGIPCLILAYMSADAYTLFTSRSIITNTFFGFTESRHSFDEIAGLKRRSYLRREKQKQVLGFYHSISFKDGTEWTTRIPRSVVSPRNLRQGERILQHISQQTGLPIVDAPPDP